MQALAHGVAVRNKEGYTGVFQVSADTSVEAALISAHSGSGFDRK